MLSEPGFGKKSELRDHAFLRFIPSAVALRCRGSVYRVLD